MNSDPYPDGLEMIEKKYGDLNGTIAMVELTKGLTGLGLSLVGNKDRKKMSVFVCGMHPKGSAFKDGRIQVGDEILEVNGYAVYGRCHLNASAVIKSLDGPTFKIIILRRSSALSEMAVKPLTQFPVHLEEETNLEAKYIQQFTGRFTLRTVTVRKGRDGLGIMIVEGRHADLGRGIFISDIQSNSPAEQSGLAVGDMILCVDQTDLIRADYETAASLLKNSEGLLSIIVAKTPKQKDQQQQGHQSHSPVPPHLTSSTIESSSTSTPVSSSKILTDPLTSHQHQQAHRKYSSVTTVPLGNNNNNNNDNLTLNKNQTQLDQEQGGTVPASLETIVTSSTSAALGITSGTTTTGGITSSSCCKGEGGGPIVALPIGETATAGVTSSSSQFVTIHDGRGASGGLISSCISSSICDPKTCAIVPGRESVIEITKGHNALGLSIAGGIDTPLGCIVICEVYLNGAAAADGRLKPGDLILQVNGLDFRSVIHAQAVKLLRSLTGNLVTLAIYREIVQPHWFKPDITCHTIRSTTNDVVNSLRFSNQSQSNLTSTNSEQVTPATSTTPMTTATATPGTTTTATATVTTMTTIKSSTMSDGNVVVASPESVNCQRLTGGENNVTINPGANIIIPIDANVISASSIDANELEYVQTIFAKLDAVEVELNKKPGKSLGIVIGSRKDASHLPIVTEILSGGIAESNGQIQIGDHLLELNGQNLTSLTYPEVVALMKATSGRMCIKIGRFHIPAQLKQC